MDTLDIVFCHACAAASDREAQLKIAILRIAHIAGVGDIAGRLSATRPAQRSHGQMPRLREAPSQHPGEIDAKRLFSQRLAVLPARPVAAHLGVIGC